MLENFVKTYSQTSDGKTFKHTATVRHNGTVIAFAMDSERRFWYSLLDLMGEDVEPNDAKNWMDEPQELFFPTEIAQVGYRIAGSNKIPVKEAVKEKKEKDWTSSERFESTTSRLTADAPFQIISDGKYVYVFRQAISSVHESMVYTTKTQGKLVEKDDESNGFFEHSMPVVDSTLLMDRFVLVGTELKSKLEIRYRRSRSKDKPQSRKDSLGTKDMDNNPFYEPTQELDMIRNMVDGRFSVLILPTSIPEIERWQLFSYNSKTRMMDSFNIERSEEGLFNIKGTQFYTCSVHTNVFESKPKRCQECERDLIPKISKEGFAESVLEFSGENDFLKTDEKINLSRSSFTMSVWFKTKSFEGTILSCSSECHPLYIKHKRLRININGYEARGRRIVADGKWHFATITGNNSNLRVFLDGKKAIDKTIKAEIPDKIAGNLCIGNVADDNITNFFAGCIDEVRIWNRARSEDEIKEDMNRRLIGNESGLFCYWEFDENFGNVFHDRSDNAFHGTLNGNPRWIRSDAPVGDNPGIRRTSFRIHQRTIESSPTALLYYQQENVTVGDNGEKKPIKGDARLLLAMATKSFTSNRKEIAAVEFSVSKEGKLAQIPDNLDLPYITKSETDVGSINDILDRIRELEKQVQDNPDPQKSNKIKELRAKITNEVALPMSLLHIDYFGLSIFGGVLAFAYTGDSGPELFDSANGKIGLYFRGEKDQFFVAYYDTNTAKATYILPTDTRGEIVLVARRTGPEMEKTTVIVQRYKKRDLCTVTLKNEELLITETWNRIPCDPEKFVRILSGNASTKKDDPFYYDYSEATIDNPAMTLSNGSLLFLPVNNNARGKINDITLESSDNQTHACSWVADSQGNALLFDGQDDYVGLVDDSKLSHFAAADDITMEAWVKPISVKSNPTALRLGADDDYVDCGNEISLSESHTIEFWISYSEKKPGWRQILAKLAPNSDRSPGIWTESNKASIHWRYNPENKGFYGIGPYGEGSQFNLGQWYHIAGVKDKDILTIYINGEKKGETKVPKTMTNGIGQFFIGKSPEWRSFYGAVDDVRIWNRVRSEDEIKEDMNRRLKGEEPDLIGYWRFDNLSVEDYSNNSKDGIIHGSLRNAESPFATQYHIIHHNSSKSNHSTYKSQYAFGLMSQEIDSALKFDGRSVYVVCEDDPSLCITEDLTLQAWVYPTGKLHGETLISKHYNGEYDITFWGKKIVYYHGPDWRKCTKVFNYKFTPNKWYHIAVVREHNAKTVKLYVDGTEEGELQYNELPPFTKHKLSIGYRINTKTEIFKGRIDEVRIWNRVCSKDEIVDNMKRRLEGDEPGLVGYWHFEYLDAKDNSENGNDGKIFGSAQNSLSPLLQNHSSFFAGVGDNFFKTRDTFPIAEWNHLAAAYNQSYALEFDGVNDYLDCGNDTTLDITGTLTMEAFFQVNDSEILQGILSKGELGGNDDDKVTYALQIRDNRIEFAFVNEDNKIVRFTTEEDCLEKDKAHKVAVSRERRNLEYKIDQGSYDTFEDIVISDIDESYEKKKLDDVLKALKESKIYTVKDEFLGRVKKEFGEEEQDLMIYEKYKKRILGHFSRSVTPFHQIRIFVDNNQIKIKTNAPGRHAEDQKTHNYTGEGAVSSDKELWIGKAQYHCDGIISEIRLWNTAHSNEEICTDITGDEKGLISWWRFEENDGKTAYDSKGENHGQIIGAKWVKNPDEKASEINLYHNGISMKAEKMGALTYDDDQMTLGGILREGKINENFQGYLEEVRIWKMTRTQEQIQDNLFRRLLGEKEHLIAYYQFDAAADNELKDHSGRDNQLLLGGSMETNSPNNPSWVISDAPVGYEIPQCRSALAGVKTTFHDIVECRPAIQEYGDFQYDVDGNMLGIMKRCYSFTKNGEWLLVTGFKIGHLIMEWIGQAQFAPQLIGYIEGAPPVPGENLMDEQSDYDSCSSIEFVDAETTTNIYSLSKEQGFDIATELKAGAGAKSEEDVGTPFFQSKIADLTIRGGIQSAFEMSNGWLNEASASYGKTVSKNSKMDISGFWDRINKRYIPRNIGFALVRSETADVFAVRLAHNNVLVCFKMLPNPDIPKDWNIITFPINQRYVKQGTLDGKLGFKSDNRVNCDPDYPNAAEYGEYSYFKPKEAYALKSKIEREEDRLKNIYYEFDTQRVVKGLGAGFVSGAAIGLNLHSILTLPIGAIGATLGAIIAADTGKITRLFKRNIVNTYVWTAEGGFFAEKNEIMETKNEVTGGAFSLKTMIGGYFEWDVTFGKFNTQLELSAMAGYHLNTTTTKAVETEKSFSLDVSLDVDRDIQKRDARGNIIITNGKPQNMPGKVDAYRFMSFYLQPSLEHFEEFRYKVVDPKWLEESNEPNAITIREAINAQQKAKKDSEKSIPWRILHRVTYVSRVLPEYSPEADDSLEKTVAAANICSNWELIKKLEPYVRDKTDDYVTFTYAVRDAIDNYLPELIPAKDDIVQYMCLYYQVFDE